MLSRQSTNYLYQFAAVVLFKGVRKPCLRTLDPFHVVTVQQCMNHDRVALTHGPRPLYQQNLDANQCMKSLETVI